MTTEETMNAIDRAIAKAKENRSRREASPKLSREERDAQRAEAKAKRDAERAERKAEKASKPSSPAHMKKVANAAAKLPSLIYLAEDIVKQAVKNLTRDQITAVALHLQHHNRVTATTTATAGNNLKLGQVVRITGGDPKFIGMTGSIETLRRIRCFVTVPGVKRPVYIFTSECEPLTGGEELPATEQQDIAAVG